ncbi:hypothetical protein BDF22DRAFT_620815, partial [Syncephalis plumigaleata]
MASPPGTKVSSTKGRPKSSASGGRVLSVKSSISGLGWADKYRGVLSDLVNTVHTTTFHAYAFAKYIFLSEFEGNADFKFEEYICEDFFKEVWLSLVKRARERTIQKEETVKFRKLISKHWNGYHTATSYQRPKLANAGQSA